MPGHGIEAFTVIDDLISNRPPELFAKLRPGPVVMNE